MPSFDQIVAVSVSKPCSRLRYSYFLYLTKIRFETLLHSSYTYLKAARFIPIFFLHISKYIPWSWHVTQKWINIHTFLTWIDVLFSKRKFWNERLYLDYIMRSYVTRYWIPNSFVHYVSHFYTFLPLHWEKRSFCPVTLSKWGTSWQKIFMRCGPWIKLKPAGCMGITVMIMKSIIHAWYHLIVFQELREDMIFNSLKIPSSKLQLWIQRIHCERCISACITYILFYILKMNEKPCF